MGYKGTIRGISSAIKSIERESRRRQKELERKQKEAERMQELERATYEVEVYENYIEVISSIHKECRETWDWNKIKSSNPPIEPQPIKTHELEAQKALDNYSPSFLDKTFKRIEKKKDKLLKKLEEAKELDKIEYQKACEEYKQKYKEWKILNEMAGKICEGDIESYTEAIKYINPFEEISEYGSKIEFQVVNENFIVADVKVREKDIIPTEVKSLLKSGKLSVKQMPKIKFNELYQDFVCGVALRVGRELFALLPIRNTIINAFCNMLNTKTGHIEEMPILSIYFPRDTLEGLNFENIDPSDSMENFVHKMNFKKNKGFGPVEVLNPSGFLK